MKCKVYVEDGDDGIKMMFHNQGYQIVNDVNDAELICFSGGADVSPMLYDAVKHPRTHSQPIRDEICANIYHSFPDVPFVGICRGAQFLNVMNGGEMWQHVEGHAIRGTHMAKDVSDGKKYQVTSTHHQMMIPSSHAEIIMTAEVSSRREFEYPADTNYRSELDDIEVLYYEDTKCLCFQPHPEYVNPEHECQKFFFLLLDQYLER